MPNYTLEELKEEIADKCKTRESAIVVGAQMIYRLECELENARNEQNKAITNQVLRFAMSGLQLKLNKAKDWAAKFQAKNAKLKEQIAADHVYIDELKKRIECLEGKVDVLWGG